MLRFRIKKKSFRETNWQKTRTISQRVFFFFTIVWYSLSPLLRTVGRDSKNFYGNVRVSDVTTGTRAFGFGKMLSTNNLFQQNQAIRLHCIRLTFIYSYDGKLWHNCTLMCRIWGDTPGMTSLVLALKYAISSLMMAGLRMYPQFAFRRKNPL